MTDGLRTSGLHNAVALPVPAHNSSLSPDRNQTSTPPTHFCPTCFSHSARRAAFCIFTSAFESQTVAGSSASFRACANCARNHLSYAAASCALHISGSGKKYNVTHIKITPCILLEKINNIKKTPQNTIHPNFTPQPPAFHLCNPQLVLE